MTIAKIRLDELRIDGQTQQRVEINYPVVTEYAESITAGFDFPAVTVFFDGAKYWLADGFHRYHATKQADKIDILCDIIKGTKRDALLFAIGANFDHGLRRTSADKRKAVLAMLSDAKWCFWSDRDIAAHCKVSHTLVSTLRKPITPLDSTTSDTKLKENIDVALNTFLPENTLKIIECQIFDHKEIENSAAFEEKSEKMAPFDGKPQDTPPVEGELYKVSTALNDEMPSEIDTLHFELAELKQANIMLEQQIKELTERNEELEFIFSKDSKLTAALEESKAWQSKFKNQMLILNNLQNDLNEHKRHHAFWKKQAGKLKFELDKIKRTA